MKPLNDMTHTITAHRISIQYDAPGEPPSNPAAALREALELFTATLQRAHPEMSPQIRTDSEDFDPEDDVTAEPNE